MAPSSYSQFLATKQQLQNNQGFEPIDLPDCLFPFQRFLAEWNIRKGRSSDCCDCGMGKTLLEYVFVDNCVRKTGKPGLIITPLSVSAQTVREGTKFGFPALQSRDGKLVAPITVTNYEKLHLFDSDDFSVVACDEASVLKDCDSVTKAKVTEFMRTIPYRLLATATPAPNDWPELGTQSECLGEMGYHDMLTKFFKQTTAKDHRGWGRTKYHIRAHGEHDFWRWVCSWARAARKPSDLGFDDDGFILPGLDIQEHIVESRTKRPGFLLDMPATTLQEQKEERRRTIRERCEKVAELVDHDQPAIAWCHLNPEGDLLAKIIPNSIQVSGRDSDEAKEEAFAAFESGQVRVMVSKPSIAGHGLNWQHCAHQTFFPSHSFEEWYQAIRRSYRFGQKRRVRIDLVASEGEAGVMANLQRKSDQADVMFSRLVALMNDHLSIRPVNGFINPEEIPSWLSRIN